MSYHEPVLLDKIIQMFNIKKTGNYLDMTLGGGGHSIEILKKLDENKGLLVGVDQDIDAINYADKRFENYNNYELYNHNFNDEKLWKKLEEYKFDGILFDLGVSMKQLKNAERGFSFNLDGPLDMRMDKNSKLTAAEVVNSYGKKLLADIIYKYGEERKSRRIARKIVENRPIKTTGELADVVRSCFSTGKRKKTRKDMATRTFQALRIYVNNELNILESALDHAIKKLKKGGRLQVISYHSLEDRIVKLKFKRESKDCICPPEIPVCRCGHKASVKLINKSVITPEKKEKDKNPSSRSAKLRVVEKI